VSPRDGHGRRPEFIDDPDRLWLPRRSRSDAASTPESSVRSRMGTTQRSSRLSAWYEQVLNVSATLTRSGAGFVERHYTYCWSFSLSVVGPFVNLIDYPRRYYGATRTMGASRYCLHASRAPANRNPHPALGCLSGETTTKLELPSKGVQMPDGLRGFMERKLQFVLGRFSHRVRRIRVQTGAPSASPGMTGVRSRLRRRLASRLTTDSTESPADATSSQSCSCCPVLSASAARRHPPMGESKCHKQPVSLGSSRSRPWWT